MAALLSTATGIAGAGSRWGLYHRSGAGRLAFPTRLFGLSSLETYILASSGAGKESAIVVIYPQWAYVFEVRISPIDVGQRVVLWLSLATFCCRWLPLPVLLVRVSLAQIGDNFRLPLLQFTNQRRRDSLGIKPAVS